MTKKLIYILSVAMLYASCSKPDKKYKFIKNNSSNITFKNTLNSTKELNILNYLYYYNGAGVATGDFNNDNLIDIYFTGNEEDDQLYLNQNQLKFKNITKESGIKNNTGWTTGVTTVDINADGLLDIYISKVSGHLHLKGHNLLFINQGLKNGIPTFKEQSKEYNLNISGLYTQASFFDYDLDGDLDVFLLGHSLHPNSNFGRGSQRTRVDSINGDKLLENKNGLFYDASAKANIFSSHIGYGLGISTSDINQDGYPDIFIGNDFFEDDYLYINQRDGTFKEVNTTEGTLGHTSHFSMGNDIADINNDGLSDIISVDMLPEHLETLKTSGTEFNYNIFTNNLKAGYQPQFMQNTLHINEGNVQFKETAFLSGISSTEWSWSPLLADFNNNGYKDIYITNGILGATNDMDFINFISNENIQKRLGSKMTNKELPFIDEIPEKKTTNYFFENNKNATFTNRSNQWIDGTPSFSNGSSYADLDNDGDLDIIVNNVNETAYLLENKTRQQSDSLHYLTVQLRDTTSNNILGIGSKIFVYTPDAQQFFENYTTRGFLSSVSPEIFIGLGQNEIIDSLKIIWPDQSYQLHKNIPVDRKITIQKNSLKTKKQTLKKSDYVSFKNDSLISFIHRDNVSFEFSRDPLIPYASTNLSKSIKVGDLNNDGLDDLIGLGAKGKQTLLYYQQKDRSFKNIQLDSSENFIINEDIDALIIDINNDNLNDLIIVSGGNEIKKGKPLQPRLYINSQDGLQFKESIFSNYEMNASSIKAIDIDNDGDLDINITSDLIPQQFAATPSQYIFRNDENANFTDISDTFGKPLKNIGNVKDIIWEDINNNGFLDAILIGHWIAPTLFINDGKTLTKSTTTFGNHKGWYNTLKVADFDKDGDLDIIAGNWGFNTRLKASQKQPIELYLEDFDNNGKTDPILTYYYQGTRTTLATKDELVKQLPHLNKEYLSYNAFAKANIEYLFSASKLESATKKQVTQLASMYFENNGDLTFKAIPLPLMSQISSVHDIHIEDFNNDGYLDVILIGNDYEISTQIGRLDSSKGMLLINNKKGFFEIENRFKLNILGASRSIDTIRVLGTKYYVVGRNNDTPLFLRKDN